MPEKIVNPLHGAVVTKYLVRIWPAGGKPPDMQQSEICTPQSVTEGQDSNDRAEILTIRAWAKAHANAEGVSYSYEVRRDSLVAALTSSESTRRVVAPIASGTVEPGDSRPGHH
jgi:hypothetical protein